MCNGPLLGKILVFSVPLMLSGILQLLFNAADIIVVGRFAGSTALAAVGSTDSLINLMINVFVGLSVGVNVLAARYYGGQKEKDIQDTVHTAGGDLLYFQRADPVICKLIRLYCHGRKYILCQY